MNDCGYTFGVQAKYASGLAQKITAKCTPKTSRFAVTGFSANAGSERVLLRWTKPETDRLSSYTITWTPGNGSQKLTDASLEQYMVNGLTNDTEYEFTLVCNYPNGDSDAVNASATPGVVSPVIMSMTEAIKYQQVTFEYNPMYFMAGEVTAVSWTFGDGGSAEGLKVVHGFSTEGTLEVKATVTYADNTSESASTEIAISGYKWSKQALSMGGYTGYVKASNPVFSPDGGMLYISTSNGQGDVFALDTWTGEIKWTFPIAKTTYGGGPVVGPDGSIYVGAQEKVFRAIKPDGTLKWSFETAGNVEAFPAITSDNKLYFVSNGSPATLYAMNATTGAADWTKELDGGTGSAVAVDAEGNIYVGTNSAIWSFSADGSQRWKSDAINVTERGSFAIDGTTLYAGLKATAGVGAIDMSTGTIKWTSNLGTNDNYFPIVGPDGTAYSKYQKILKDNNLNALVVEMKNDEGVLKFKPNSDLLKQKGYASAYGIDVEKFVKTFKEDGIYLIARVVVFKDKNLADYAGGKYAVWNYNTKRPWIGVKSYNADGTASYYGENWVDPYCEEVWEYNVAVANELIERGFDEIQFDYIRFPTDGINLGSASYRWKDTGMDKESALMSFLAYARKNVKGPIGIDIYGNNGWYRSGVRTGQDVEMLSQYVDVICPMFYPSHFEQYFLESSPVAERPYRIYFYGTYRNQVIGRNRIVVRPWVQSFYMGVRYDVKWYDKNYVRREIYGVRDATNNGYMYWNNAGNYADLSPDPDPNTKSPWHTDESDLQQLLPAFSSPESLREENKSLMNLSKPKDPTEGFADMISIWDSVLYPSADSEAPAESLGASAKTAVKNVFAATGN